MRIKGIPTWSFPRLILVLLPLQLGVADRVSSADKVFSDVNGFVSKTSCTTDNISCNSTVTGTLSASDCSLFDGTFVDLWQFQGTAGSLVAITMESLDFDAYLGFLDPDANTVAEDNNSGDFSDARISYQLTETGTWTIAANSAIPGTGTYTLSLACDSGTEEPPVAPSNLTARALSSSEVELTWDDNSDDETEFHIEVLEVDGFFDIGTVPANSVSTIVQTLKPDHFFTFRMRAWNLAGYSEYSNEANATTPPESPKCTEGATRLCFNNGRFSVEVEWRDFRDRTGFGRKADLYTDEAGIFWFFNSANWELLVKVLDGCAVNGHFWVFAGATTNVEYSLRVTDVLTGTTASYFNPLGQMADTITDTDAFATCP